MSDTADRVKKIVVEHLGVEEDKVKEAAHFIDDLGADSLDTVELVMAFEEEFGIEILTTQPKRSPPSRTRSTTFRPTPEQREQPELEMRRVVVTGLGAVTPLACGIEETWNRLLKGESGAATIRKFETGDLATNYGCEIKPKSDEFPDGFDADEWVDPKEQRRVDEFIVYGLAAAKQALADPATLPIPRNSSSVRVCWSVPVLADWKALPKVRRHCMSGGRAGSRRSSFLAG